MLRLGLVFASVLVVCFGAIDILRLDSPADVKAPSLSLAWQGDSFEFTLQSQEGKQLKGILGGFGSLPPDIPAPTQCGSILCWKFGTVASLTLTPTVGGQCYDIEWHSQFSSIKDCFQLGSSHWYGGPELYEQSWPIDMDQTMIGEGKSDMPFVTGDFFQKDFGGVLEPYWINTDGFGLHTLRENPLFVSWNNSRDNQLCLASRFDFPYPRHTEESGVSLRYTICSASDVKSIHLLALSNNFWNKPRDIPDERMLTDPVWSTWARYKTNVSDSIVLSFADQIRANGFNDSQLEIDDRWETCYGELTFDPIKFPDPKQMNSQLHSLGFRVTLWIHPFINLECPSFSTASRFVVSDSKGNPALTSWWQGNLAGYFDFTKPAAATWWSNRVLKLKTDFDFDGFKIDAGETNWLPSAFDFSPQLPLNITPNGFSEKYSKNMELIGPMTEVRTGWNSQEVPIFTRMLDKESLWNKSNGLATLIPTLLHFGLIGYPFVLPDMIGGNGYGTVPDKELFVRWMQANVFMPAMQFSYTPWDYNDAEVVAIAQRMTKLHYQYAPTIISLARQATESGYPINRPIWWLDPLDPVAQTIDSEYLLGDDLLVAPVVDQYAVTKDIYLPSGNWRDEVDPAHQVYTGPMWIRAYPAPLDTLPYFTRSTVN